MRKDMSKVVTNLARGGSHLPNRKSRLHVKGKQVNGLPPEELECYDGGPLRLPMSPRNRYVGAYGDKSGGKRWAPLHRFFQSRVGQPWNKVHSEMTGPLTKLGLKMGQDLKGHIESTILLDCFIAPNGKMFTRRFGWSREVTGLFVHPTTGILSYVQPKREPSFKARNAFMKRLVDFGFKEIHDPGATKNENWKNFRIVNELLVLEKKSGLWFAHIFAHHEPLDVVGEKYDPLTGLFTQKFFKDSPKTPSRYKKSILQLGKSDLKKYRESIAGNPF